MSTIEHVKNCALAMTPACFQNSVRIVGENIASGREQPVRFHKTPETVFMLCEDGREYDLSEVSVYLDNSDMKYLVDVISAKGERTGKYFADHLLHLGLKAQGSRSSFIGNFFSEVSPDDLFMSRDLVTDSMGFLPPFSLVRWSHNTADFVPLYEHQDIRRLFMPSSSSFPFPDTQNSIPLECSLQAMCAPMRLGTGVSKETMLQALQDKRITSLSKEDVSVISSCRGLAGLVWLSSSTAFSAFLMSRYEQAQEI